MVGCVTRTKNGFKIQFMRFSRRTQHFCTAALAGLSRNGITGGETHEKPGIFEIPGF